MNLVHEFSYIRVKPIPNFILLHFSQIFFFVMGGLLVSHAKEHHSQDSAVPTSGLCMGIHIFYFFFSLTLKLSTLKLSS